MFNQRLSQKLLQKLSPQQIQLIKLLQVPTANLEQRIKEELEANPALEEGYENEVEVMEEPERQEETAESEQQEVEDDIDLTEYMIDDDIADYKLYNRDGGYQEDEDRRDLGPATTSTFNEHLLQQLGLLKLDHRRQVLAKHLIGSIDEDGYLRRPLESIVDDIAFSQNIMTTEEELESALKIIQGFDPPGVGARDLRECLLLQLQKKDESDPHVKLAERILTKYFDAFTKKQYDKLQGRLSIGEEKLKDAINEILKLNPKPGGGHIDNNKSQQYVIPDFIVSNEDGELILTLNNRNAPELRISNSYREMLAGYGQSKKKDKAQKDAVMFIKQKIDSAKWFIEALRQRQETMLYSMKAILDYQYRFFLTGDETELRPMILKDIADRTGFDISTISRVANSKYVQTEFGTFSLKYFFSESLTNESGEEISTTEVKNILKGIIGKEDKKKPYSDQKLTEMLKEKGYVIARRTVAKYREQMNIPVARLRKEL